MTESKRYAVNEIFYSIQGEGVMVGTPMVFIRFAGCNLKCSKDGPEGFDCDTEFVSHRMMTAREIVDEADQLIEQSDGPEWLLLTGGEPMLQVDVSLIAELQQASWKIAMETNGTVEWMLPPIDWVCCSPKSAEHTIRMTQCSEVKYVRGHGQGIPKPTIDATHHLLSPAFDGLEPDRRAIDWCVRLVKQNPSWRLSVQLHKLLGVR